MYILILCNAQIVLRYTMHIGYPMHIATVVLLDDHAAWELPVQPWGLWYNMCSEKLCSHCHESQGFTETCTVLNLTEPRFQSY